MNTLVAGNTVLRVCNAFKQAAFTALGVATLSLFALSANATSVADPSTQTVEFKDLDLSRASDAKRLYRRLRMAASEVCVNYAQSTGMPGNTPRARCEQAALTNAIEAIAHPNLTALHLESAGVKLAQGKTKPASIS